MHVVERRILKQSLHRSVRLEIDADGVKSVVKRFESRTLSAATLDRARATREHRLLEELAARDFASPRPLGLERVGAGWEVRMEWIDSAVSLADVLSGRAPWPTPPERVARELARLLAALHELGVDHPDLHPGNVLLDPRGRPWAIDFHKARRTRATKPATALRDLVSLEAGVRESAPAGFRTRFFVEWMRNAPTGLVEALLARVENSRERLAEQIEDRARRRRFAAVRKRRKRWLRESSSCVELDGPPPRFRRASASGDASAKRTWTLEKLSKRDALAVWCSAARLEEHGLACAAPLELTLGSRPVVRLIAPADGAPLVSAEHAHGARALHSLGVLCAQLADRRLRLRTGSWPALWRSSDGRLAAGAVLGVEEDPRGGDGLDLVRTLALAGLELGALSPRERAAYAAGILAGASRSGRANARLRGDLKHG